MKQLFSIWLCLSSLWAFTQEEKATVEFSPEGGLYAGEKVVVALSVNAPGARIFYTLNGDLPNSESREYRSPIRVNNVATIRARAYVKGRPTEVATQSYFTNRKYTTAVVSVVVDSNEFWNDTTGIYKMGFDAEEAKPYKGANFWKDKELSGNIEIYEPDGDQLINQVSGVKIFGGYSRSNAQKSLALIARKRYGKNRFHANIFPDLNNDKFKGLVLRNSGGDFNKTMFRDAYMTFLARPTGLDVQDHRPAAVYINGQYWGLMNIREKINEHYIEDHHDVDDDSLDLMEHRMDLKEGSRKHYLAMLAWMKEADMTDNADIRHLNTLMEVDNYIAYNIAEVYSDNRDAGGNIRYWRPHRDGGRWRWIFYDLDMGLACTNWKGYKRNTLKKFTSKNDEKWPDPPWSTFITRKLLENDSIRNVYVNTLADHLNWVYHEDTAVRKLDLVAGRMASEMVYHARRWGGDSARWAKYVDIVREFVTNRPSYMRQHVLEKFDLKDTVSVSFLPPEKKEGKLYLNGYRIKRPFNGIYFASVKVRLDAVPRFDYQFSHWEGLESSDPVVYVDPANLRNVFPVFEPKPGSEGPVVVINEFSYNDEDKAGDWIELYNASGRPVNLEGWVIKDNSDNHEFTLPDINLASGEYLAIIEEENKFESVYGRVSSVDGFDVGLSSKGDKIRLYDHSGLMVDSVSFDFDGKWSPSETGVFELLTPEKENSESSNWVIARKPTPGSINPRYEQYLITKEKTAELRVWFLAGGGVLMLIGLGGVFLWRRRSVD